MNSRKIYLITIISFLILFSCGRKRNTVTTTIIHWNDFHAANQPYKPTYKNPKGFKVGGYANLAGYVDSLKKIYPAAVTMNAGDDFQGSPVSSITQGQSQILILNALGLDIFTLGNHEFDYGFKNLKENIKLAEFPVISSNVLVKKNRQLMVKPYKILNSDGVRIGVIGVMMESLKSSSLPQNVKEIEVIDALEQVRKYADSLESRVDLTVVLSHQGYHADSVLATRLEEMVDIIVGGHSHTWLAQPVKVNDILVCQAGSRGERLGVLNARVDTVKNRIENYNYEFIRTIVGRVKPDPEVKKVVDSLDAKIAQRMDKKIGTLEREWIRSSRDDANIGNWITDALRGDFDTDIAFQNSGGIRKNLSAGPITVRDIWEICPFDNTVEIITVDGQTLKGIVKWRIENPRDLLQTSGMKRVFNSKTDSLLELEVHDKQIMNGKKYTIATNNYITGHAKRFFGIPAEELNIKHTGILVRDVLIEHVKDKPVISGKKTEDRIVDVAQN